MDAFHAAAAGTTGSMDWVEWQSSLPGKFVLLLGRRRRPGQAEAAGLQGHRAARQTDLAEDSSDEEDTSNSRLRTQHQLSAHTSPQDKGLTSNSPTGSRNLLETATDC